ncbi:MAG: glycosyltransferase family 2 protein [bacterium]
MEPIRCEISVVAPLYNEEANVRELHTRLTKVLEGMGRSYEIIFVDDGSRDATFSIAKELTKGNANLTLVRLRRNFGQTAGLSAGLDRAGGRVIVAMDGDLQHFPEDIPLLLAKIDEGYEMASGWRKKRVDNFWLRRFPSMIANWLMAKLSGVKLHDFGAVFKAYRREVIEDLDLYGELHRFIPALVSWKGISVAEVPIQNIVRPAGKSNYGLSRTFRVLMDLLTVKFMISYIARPLHFFGFIGLALFAVGFAVAFIITIFYYFGNLVIAEHLGNLIFAMLSMVLGIQLVALGLSLEVSTRIYHTTHGRRIYAVRGVYREGQEIGGEPEGSVAFARLHAAG